MLIAYIFFYQDIKRSYMTFKINITNKAKILSGREKKT